LLANGERKLPVFNWLDKAQDALAFVTLTAGALLQLPTASVRVVIGMVEYGEGIELAQWALGRRFAEWVDLAANTMG
jgi:hypothetical protein